jgi:hypothetical protein
MPGVNGDHDALVARAVEGSVEGCGTFLVILRSQGTFLVS